MRCCCGNTGSTKSKKAAWITMLLSGVAVSAIALGGVKKDPPKGDPKPTTPVAPAPTTPPVKPEGSKDKPATPAAKEPTSVYDFTMNRIDGTSESLSTYKGKVLLIVNVASKCGYTPQYGGLQRLYSEKKESGLVVLGFPANDFKAQEPGTNDEIMRYCSGEFGVTFPMFEKITVRGEDVHPLYQFLAKQPAPIGGEPKWNFTKFLVGRDGKVVARFDSEVKPEDSELTKRIDELLAVKAPEGEKKKDEPKKGG